MGYAIIKSGGIQFKVAEGDKIDVHKLDAEVGSEVQLGEVLFQSDGQTANIGDPLVEGATVTAQVVEQYRAKKVTAFKFKRRKGYHKTKGHRQPMTKLQIKSINL